MLQVNQLTGFGAGGGIGGNDTYTKLLLHCDGADGGTTFTDSSASPHTATAVGNAQIDQAESKFGGAAALFDGTGDYLTLDGSSDFAFAAADFTIDFWVRFASVSGTPILYDSRPLSTSGAYPTLYISAGVIVYFTASATRITSSTSLSTGVWYHVALVRASGTTKLYINGTKEGADYVDANSYANGASRPTIAVSGFDLSTPLNGWMDEIRVSNGIARWTANFTPPTDSYS
jgi:hypothetical protein